jgi:hypothetical protein
MNSIQINRKPGSLGRKILGNSGGMGILNDSMVSSSIN